MSHPLTLILLLIPLLTLTTSQPSPLTTPLPPSEQTAVYSTLEAINPTLPWRTLYPDDLCQSSPHGIVCSYFPQNDTVYTPHIVELNLGYVSESSPNPPCTPLSLFPPSLSLLPYLRKLLFFRCFTSLPVFPSLGSGLSDLEELVFIDNPSLSGPLSAMLGNFTSLRRLIITNTNLTGGIPDQVTKLPSLEQVTISGNRRLQKGIPGNVGMLRKLKVLDLSGNRLTGQLPASVGELSGLVKLDLSENNLTGVIPESLGRLKRLEFLDLSENDLNNNIGVPRCLGEMEGLREVYLSGNKLGGVIPEIWEKLGGVLGIGMSSVGVKGGIPRSMGVFLGKLSFVYLDGNELEGEVPREFGELLEVDLRGNKLSGRIPFSAPQVERMGKKLKVEGNVGLCVGDVGLRKGSLGSLEVCGGEVLGNVNSALYVNGGLRVRVCGCLVAGVVAFWSFWWL